MYVNEDGGVTGSIDVSRLDEVEPKTDEARAQLDALKADRDAGQEQAARDAERLAKLHAASNPLARQAGEDAAADTRDAQGKETVGRPQGGGVQQPAGGDGSNGGDGGDGGGGQTTQAQPSAADGAGDSSGGGAPAQAEPKAAWVDYAVSQGVSREEAEASSKSDLVGRFGSGR